MLPAVFSGGYVQRWGPTPELRAAAEALPDFPEEFGDWQLTAEVEPLRDAVSEELGLESDLRRIYRNLKTGQVIDLLVMVGQPGRLVRHPPEICIGNRANRIRAEEDLEIATGDASHRFRIIQYDNTRAVDAQLLAVAFAHCDDVRWDVPSTPRVAYGAAPLLHKVLALIDVETGEREFAAAEFEPFLENFVVGFVERRE